MHQTDTHFNALRAATWRFAQTEEKGVELLQTASEVGQELAGEAAAAAAAERSDANRLNLIAAVLVMLSLVGSVIFTFIGVARPLTALNGALGKMAEGALNVVIPGASRGDEVGDIAKTVIISKNAEIKARERNPGPKPRPNRNRSRPGSATPT